MQLPPYISANSASKIRGWWWLWMINETYFSVMFHKTRLADSAACSFVLASYLSVCLPSAGWRGFQRAIMTRGRTGSPCPSPRPTAPACRWRACPRAQSISSASCLKIKWGRDPSARSPPLGLWVRTISFFFTVPLQSATTPVCH